MNPRELPFFRIGQGRDCCYCGDPATCRDHVVPVSFQTLIPRRKGTRIRFGPTAAACFDCNAGLSDRFFNSFDARCQFARDRLAKRAKPIHWSEAELNKLDYKLQTYARRSTQLYKWMRGRADWYESADYFRNLDARHRRRLSRPLPVLYRGRLRLPRHTKRHLRCPRSTRPCLRARGHAARPAWRVQRAGHEHPMNCRHHPHQPATKRLISWVSTSKCHASPIDHGPQCDACIERALHRCPQSATWRFVNEPLPATY